MSLCDLCREPGACCRNFVLSGLRPSEYPTELEALIGAASTLYVIGETDQYTLGLPFIPNGKAEDSDTYFWTCVWLDASGRCSNYDIRPNGPCVVYKPKIDPLCAMHNDYGACHQFITD